MDGAPGRWRWVALAAGVLLAAAFAYLNGGERVSLHLGLFVLYRVSLVGLVFLTFLLGMVVMFLIGLRQDLRVRRLLEQHRAHLPPPPRPETAAWEPERPPDVRA